MRSSSGRATSDTSGPATNEIPAQYLDATRARETLGWEPRFNLDDGLAQTVAWYRTHLG